MRHKIRFFLLALLTGCLLGGCLVWRVQNNPELTGRVLDQDTKKPISMALTSLLSNPEMRVSTDDAGYFHIPATYEWTIILPLPIDRFLRADTLIQKKGYYPAIKRFEEYKDRPIYLKLEER